MQVPLSDLLADARLFPGLSFEPRSDHAPLRAALLHQLTQKKYRQIEDRENEVENKTKQKLEKAKEELFFFLKLEKEKNAKK